MKTFLELYDELKEKSKGVYYYMNLRKKKGTSRPKGHPKAPSEDDLKRAAQTAKEQLYDKIGNVRIIKPIIVKPKPLGTAPKLGGQTKRGYKVVARPPKLPESEVQDTKDNHRRQNQARRQKQQQELETAARIDARNKQREQEQRERKKDQEKQQRQRQTQSENAQSLAVIKKKIKSGTKLGSTETSSAKARGLIPRADGTKRKSPKYK